MHGRRSIPSLHTRFGIFLGVSASSYAVKQADVLAVELSDKIEIIPGKLSIGTMHLAKGLEFRSVAVMACDDEIIPSQERIENVPDDADLEESMTAGGTFFMSLAPVLAIICW